MKIAALQTENSEDISKNKAGVRDLVAQAAKQGADLVVLPEMSILEFFPRLPHRYEFFDLAESVPGPTLEWFQQLAREHDIHIVYNHYEKSREHVFFDTAFVVDRAGKFVGRQRMMHIAEEPGYNEKFYYAAGWDQYNVFDLDGWRLGVATCYDRHFPEVFRSLIVQGAELVVVPTAVAASEPFADIFELEARAAGVTHGIYIALANRVGNEPPLQFLGNSMVVDPFGEIISSLGDKGDGIALAELSKERITKARTMFPFLRDRRPETYARVAMSPYSQGRQCSHTPDGSSRDN